MATSKKDYIAIAKILRKEYELIEQSVKPENKFDAYATLINISSGLAKYFAEDNALFDSKKFAKAINEGIVLGGN